jgi:hypothetical protein
MTAMISDSSPEAGGRMKSRERPAGRDVLHGRAAEQKVIRDLLRRAQRGAGGVLLVDGEPGIGRSLLLRNATDEGAEQGFPLAAGAADQLGQATPFFALRAALRGRFAGPATDYPGRDLPGAAAWWITQIRAHLQQRAAVAPVLVCLDDLHWASPATLAALRILPRDLKRHPVAWLLARAVISWDSGQISDELEPLRDAARHGTGISADARRVQPLLALAAGCGGPHRSRQRLATSHRRRPMLSDTAVSKRKALAARAATVGAMGLVFATGTGG